MKRIVSEALNILLVILGILSAGMGLKGFLLSSRFIDGGVTGISMLLADVTRLPLAVWILIINLPFIGLGLRQIGWKFALKSALAIAGLAACLAVIKYPDVTPDRLLTAVFGGFFIGAGIGLAIRGGAVLDGTEIAALLISKHLYVLRVGDVILVLNIFIFMAAAFLLGIESALYSILTYFAASKTIDFILHGIEGYNGVTIISASSEEIRGAVLTDLGRGMTVYQGRGGFSETEQQILFCVVSRLELGKLRKIVNDIDRDAFVLVNPISDVSGGFLKRRPVH
jgi:uncharacterized membrane-anchored protein YitT (DUF2179 family)